MRSLKTLSGLIAFSVVQCFWNSPVHNLRQFTIPNSQLARPPIVPQALNRYAATPVGQPGADLRGYNLNGLALVGANLSEVNLSGANLRGFDLRGVNFTLANLRGADLGKAVVSGGFRTFYPLSFRAVERRS